MIPNVSSADEHDTEDIPEDALTAYQIDINNSVDILCTAGSLRLQVLLPPRPPPHLLLVTFTDAVISILHANVQWMLDLPAINNFTPNEQVSILKNCWAKLVLLSLGMFNAQLSLEAVLTEIKAQLEQVSVQQRIRDAVAIRLSPNALQVLTRNDQRYDDMMEALLDSIQNSVRILQIYVKVSKEMNISQPEYARLRAYSLFVPDNLPNRLARKLIGCKECAYDSLEREYGHDFQRITDLNLILDYVADITEYPPLVEIIILLPHVHRKFINNIIMDLMDIERRRRSK